MSKVGVYSINTVMAKCFNQHVGINKIGDTTNLITKSLRKEDFRRYTGHCFKRSSVTFLANAGGDLICIKRHRGWKSSTMTEGYIEDSTYK